MYHYIATAFAFCIFSIWLKEIIELVSGLLLAPKFGFRISRIHVFNQEFSCQNGTWMRSTGKFSYLIQHLVTVDISKPVPENIETKEKQLEALRLLILSAISGLLCAACSGSIRAVFGSESPTTLDYFLCAFGIGMVFHTLSAIGIRIYTYGVMMKRMGGYVNSLTRRLRAGESYTSMNLRPIEELPYKNITTIEKMFYYCFYLSAMLEQNQIGALQKPTHEMTAYFRGREYIVAETWSYYWLIFYYSRFELNPAAATHFFERIRSVIENDTDANAKRVLAYYTFGIEQNFPKARALLNDAYAVIDKFSLGAERALERRLLDELDGFLRAKGC